MPSKFEQDRRIIKYSELKTVRSQRNDVIPEEFPEGAYGSSLPVESLDKSNPWRPEQETASAFGYENLELHEGLQRDYPGEDSTN